ncbi:MAG: hypothetical protein AAFU71_06185 [Cyanobacteria bacterium J06632_22]
MGSHDSPQLPYAQSGHRPLSLNEHYRCPICASGELSAIVLTDAFACDFCRHIFTTNLLNQSVQVVDTAQPMVWFWTGERWRRPRQGNAQVTVTICVVSMMLSCLPAALIALSSYIFPPLNPATGISFTTLWASLALLLHSGMVLWLIAEHYQWPWYVSTKVRLQQLALR